MSMLMAGGPKVILYQTAEGADKRLINFDLYNQLGESPLNPPIHITCDEVVTDWARLPRRSNTSRGESCLPPIHRDQAPADRMHRAILGKDLLHQPQHRLIVSLAGVHFQLVESLDELPLDNILALHHPDPRDGGGLGGFPARSEP